LNGAGSELDFGFGSYLSKSGLNPGMEALINVKESRIIEGDFVNAAVWMVRTNVFRQIGGLAPLFFHYGEDRDFVSRAHFHGLKIGVVSGCEIRHYRDARNMDVYSWPTEKLQRYYYTGWLSRACDMTRTLSSGWFAGFRWAFSEAVAAMFKG